MSELPESRKTEPTTPTERLYQFTVSRGMTAVLLIETPSWYLGLVQSALARVALDHN